MHLASNVAHRSFADLRSKSINMIVNVPLHLSPTIFSLIALLVRRVLMLPRVILLKVETRAED